jgi:hypothetical protein
MFAQCVMLVAILMGGPLYGPYPKIDKTDPVIKEFDERVKEYWRLHQKIEATAPKKKEDPANIVVHERALADGIRAARMKAAEGDIFTPAVQKILVSEIRKGLAASADGRKARDMILGEGNPTNPESKARVDLKVNAKYPSNAPLATVPPSVLLQLPQLPEVLQYRFVGRHLILFDVKANLIVDILRNAIR